MLESKKFMIKSKKIYHETKRKLGRCNMIIFLKRKGIS